MTINYAPTGVCSRKMTVSAENGIITEAIIIGGCDGNLKGISKLLVGMKLADAIERLEGTVCGNKASSCPDQLSIVMKQLQTANA